ncbi:MAG: tetratricopeptide repeat protein, partial [Planctomycetaceae bacterium]
MVWFFLRILAKRYRMPRTSGSTRIVALAFCVLFSNTVLPAWADDNEIFLLPERFNAIRRTLAARQNALRNKRLDEAELRSAEAVRIMPGLPETLLLLAGTQAERGKTEKAFETLSKAIDAGMNNAKTLDQPVFAKLKEIDGWNELVERAKTANQSDTAIWRRPAVPAEAKNGVAKIEGKNTMWAAAGNVLVAAVRIPEDVTKKQVVSGNGKAEKLIRRWHDEGTAAGNYGDLYDNHDRDHSNMQYKSFPQLTRIEYGDGARVSNLDWGCQLHMLFNNVVIGNSSTSLVTKKVWRSQTRLMCSRPDTANQLYNQYANNHLYFYPEHRDYDAGRNGKGPEKGYGDVFFANVPYTIVSKGSSGSDRPFMRAVALTLAAFRPEVKKKLVEKKLLSPTLQMIFRRCNRDVISDETYLTGVAHPPVFDAKKLNPLGMVEMAHSIELEHLPPLSRIRMIRETAPKGLKTPEVIFNTYNAIARVHRTTDYVRRMQLDASPSLDANGEKLTYHWKVLLGDADRIKIKKLDEAGSKVEIEVPW